MYLIPLGGLTTNIDTKDVCPRGPLIVNSITPTYSLPTGVNEFAGGTKISETGYRYPNSGGGGVGGSLLNRGFN